MTACEECGYASCENLRNYDTPEARAFWAGISESAEYIKHMPAWAKAFYHPDEICKTCGHARIRYGFDGA